MTGLALLAEVAEVLGQHATLRCAPLVEMDDGAVILTVRVVPEEQQMDAAYADVVELFHALALVADVAQMRGFAARYGIEPERLEALLPRKEDA